MTEGWFGDTALDDVNAAIVFEAPVRMYEGNWTQRIYLDERATAAQRAAAEAVLSGVAGGPWEALGQFVATRLVTKSVPMTFEDTGGTRRMTVPGLFETEVVAIPGHNGRGPVTLSNLYNVIHGVIHTLARGRTVCHDAPFDFSIERTHGLFSEFSWAGGKTS